MADYTNDYSTKNQQQNQANPSKSYTHFLYKALIVTIFLVIPSQAPEFINQTLNTRGWEFLHLLLVGIVVSYGLFSRRNDETEKENITNNSKFDNAQSYVSRFLQVSSVFDEEADSPTRLGANKVQTWSNQYYRKEPMVVVAEEHTALDKTQRGTSSRISQKPLLLPVRSLKSRVVDADVNETSKESTAAAGSLSRSSYNAGSKRFSSNSSKSKNGEFGGLEGRDFEEKLENTVVLPSPIPWRSRSGRMEVQEMNEDVDSPPIYAVPPSMEESEYNRSVRAQVSRSPRVNSTTSSPKLSPSPSMSLPKKFLPSNSFSSEAQGKSAEEFVRKKSFYRSPPPPPPPPPPPSSPPMIRKTSWVRPSANPTDDDFIKKELKRSFTSEPKELNNGGNLSMPKSGRITRSSDSLGGAWKEQAFDDGIDGKAEKSSKEFVAATMDRTGRKAIRFDQSSFKTEKLNQESVTYMPQTTFRDFPKEEKEEFVEKLVMESDEDSDTNEDEDVGGSSFASHLASRSNDGEAASSSVSDGGPPDVDKKADEFIAKFRESIRVQRIESIKRSSAQISKKAAR